MKTRTPKAEKDLKRLLLLLRKHNVASYTQGELCLSFFDPTYATNTQEDSEPARAGSNQQEQFPDLDVTDPEHQAILLGGVR